MAKKARSKSSESTAADPLGAGQTAADATTKAPRVAKKTVTPASPAAPEPSAAAASSAQPITQSSASVASKAVAPTSSASEPAAAASKSGQSSVAKDDSSKAALDSVAPVAAAAAQTKPAATSAPVQAKAAAPKSTGESSAPKESKAPVAKEPEVKAPKAKEPTPKAPELADAPAADKDTPEQESIAPYFPPRPTLFIVQIAPEMAPVAKVGGLADVVFGLTRELAIRGNHVEIILPKYDSLRYDHIFEMHRVFDDLWVPWFEGAIHCTVYFGFVHSRKCFFIEPHSQDNFFNRGSIYGFNDDIHRYAFFSRAAMEFLWKAGKHPDIIHCHDWQTALAPVFLYEFYQQLGMTHPRACLTIHNFKHQGITGPELLRATGLNQPERFMDRLRMGDNHHPNAINLLKGGIVYSNFVTTVSPRYAFETKDQGQGFGLEPTLHTHHMKYGGVVNGIDYDVWNPEVDHYIPVRYGIENLDGKYDDKRALRHRLMLVDNEKPIVAFIGRLDPQKGLELVRHAIFYALEHGAQFVLLGSSPDHRINNDFWGLKHMLNDSPDCHLEIGFDEELAHLIYAGSDMMLVPSQFEPCGLTQLIALRYGTIPVVRTVGGLADTVFDKDYSERPLHERNGYRFDNYDGAGLESALGRAIDCYYGYPEHFRELIKNAMRCDYSWNHPGQDYLNIYDFIRSR